MAVHALKLLLRGHAVQPLLAIPARGVELCDLAGFAVITHDGHRLILAFIIGIAKQAGPNVHLGHTGKGLLRERWEVEHGDLAILLLHLRDRILVTNVAAILEYPADRIAVGRYPRDLVRFRER